LLKIKYPNHNLRQTYDKWLTGLDKKPFTNTVAMNWFEAYIKTVPAPAKPIPTQAELDERNKTYANAQKQVIERLLSDFGITLSNEVSVLISDACALEGLTQYTVHDWLNSEGQRPVYPKIKELYQLVLKHKTNLTV